MSPNKLQFNVEVPQFEWEPVDRAEPTWYQEAGADIRKQYAEELIGHRDEYGKTNCTPETCRFRSRHWRQARKPINRLVQIEMQINLNAIAEELGKRAARTKSGKASAQHGDIKVKLVRVIRS